MHWHHETGISFEGFARGLFRLERNHDDPNGTRDVQPEASSLHGDSHRPGCWHRHAERIGRLVAASQARLLGAVRGGSALGRQQSPAIALARCMEARCLTRLSSTGNLDFPHDDKRTSQALALLPI